MLFDFTKRCQDVNSSDGRTLYLHTSETNHALNVALATRRPLLVSGAPGSGKSELATDAAAQLDCSLDRAVLTSRTEAQNLLYTFDSLHRLHDAYANLSVTNLRHYIQPEIFWRALSPASAREFSRPKSRDNSQDASPSDQSSNDSAVQVPPKYPSSGTTTPADPRTPRLPDNLILLDEIDKAEPDLPNNLLDVLDAGRFFVRELRQWVKLEPNVVPPLVILTTNQERSLSRAFLRRCICLHLTPPDENELLKIAQLHFGLDHDELCSKLAKHIVKLREEYKKHQQDRPSTAEYIDAVRACIKLEVDPASDFSKWKVIERLVLRKDEIYN